MPSLTVGVVPLTLPEETTHVSPIQNLYNIFGCRSSTVWMDEPATNTSMTEQDRKIPEIITEQRSRCAISFAGVEEVLLTMLYSAKL